MEHHFDVDLAKEYGILEAVMLNHFWFWISKNEANDQNYHDGKYWTYNSIKAFEQMFPYATKKQIRVALSHLIDLGILITGNYNTSSYDRTLWYAFSTEGESIFHRGQIDLPYRANGIATEGKPIPDNNTDNNTDNKPDNILSIKPKRANGELINDFEQVWSMYPRKQGKENAFKAYLKARKDGVDRESIERGLEAYLAYIKAEKVDPKYIKMGSTWFNQRCWEDDYSAGHKVTTKDLAGRMDFNNFLEG